MKYLFLLLLSVAGFNAYSQIAVLNADSARLGNPAGTGTVALHGTTLIKNIAEGNAADSVLVRGSDGAVRFVKRSSFGALGIPFSNGDNLPGSNYNGRFLFNTSLQKFRIYDATAGTWKDATPVDMSNYYTKANIDSLTTSFGTQLFNFVQDRALNAEVLHKTGNENKTGDLGLVGTFSVNGLSYFNNLLQVSNPGTDQYLPVAHFYAPNNTVAGNTSQFRFGTAGTYNNAAEWRFMYNGDQSNSNRMDFSFFGQGNPIISYTAERRVGIGTTTPAYLLDVNGEARIKTQLLLGENAISHGSYQVDMRRNGTGNSQGVFMATQNGYDIALRQNAGTDNFGIYTEQTNTDAFTLTQSGNVGIGNLTPNEKLEVSGNIKTTGGIAATSFNKVNITAPVNGSTLTIADGASLITSGAFSNTLTTTATSNNTLPSGTNTLYSTKSASVTSAQLATTLTDETGTGTVVLSASPTLTGTPTAPTAASGTNTTQLATTAYVQTALSTVNINTQTANYTLVLADAGKFVQQNVSSANNVTVPANASVAFPVGTQILLRQMGSGQVTVVAASGVTLQSADNALKSRVQFAPITLIKVATNTWAVMGDLTN
ncbi:hypothetical protein [Pedobacter rhodius]|uniref:T9SS C-terminal target domain-containing protein n=1 Tax=Pedobacter rhodius TaxID=3004098 RepID=A0ABT4KU94_9SPHI|nr:hypothetical protein [Pedobacter sp. SJ11]MCZ4222515.1 hypothetical protein [Pedobacter sp. SJ11]